MGLALARLSVALLGLFLTAGTMVSEAPVSAARKMGSEYWMYVGTAVYDHQTTNSLYVCRFNSTTGELNVVGVAAETVNPGFIAVHPTRPISLRGE